MDTLTSKSEATFAIILEAAMQMAAAEGIGKLSLGEIAKRTGISKSGVFSRVGSLEQLQCAVLDEYDRRFAAEVFMPSLQLPRGLPRLQAQVAAWFQRAADEIHRPEARATRAARSRGRGLDGRPHRARHRRGRAGLAEAGARRPRTAVAAARRRIPGQLAAGTLARPPARRPA